VQGNSQEILFCISKVFRDLPSLLGGIMLQQKAQIGKTAVLIITLLFLITLAAMPLFLRADSTGELTPEAYLFLPFVQKDTLGTPDPGSEATATPTQTPTATQTATGTATPIASSTATPTASNTATPDNTSTPTPVTPEPADLVIGQPILLSTPPLIVYQPVAFQVPITNTGDLAITNLFFVDLLFDPPATHFTDVYAAVSGLSGNKTVTLTITSTIGFANFAGIHQVTGWVDSLDDVAEVDETNNLSIPLDVPIANFGGTPTSTPTPNGTETISGATLILQDSLLPIERATITLIDETSGIPIASTYSDENGSYALSNIPTGTSYTAQACIFIDNQPFFGLITGITAPTTLANIIMVPQSCP
jgi:hypothetical protein